MKYLLLIILLVLGCSAKFQAIYPSKPPINGNVIVEQVLASTPLLYNSKEGVMCTSIAISPNIALTARHCIQTLTTDDKGKLWFSNINHELHTDMGFYPDLNHDIAAVRVTPPFPKWITADIMDPLPAYQGEAVSSYGYGCSKTHELVEHTDVIEQPHSMIWDNNMDYILMKGHACPGDSGGPVIRQSGNVMGVTVTVTTDGTMVGVTPVWVDGAASWPGLSALL